MAIPFIMAPVHASSLQSALNYVIAAVNAEMAAAAATPPDEVTIAAYQNENPMTIVVPKPTPPTPPTMEATPTTNHTMEATDATEGSSRSSTSTSSSSSRSR